VSRFAKVSIVLFWVGYYGWAYAACNVATTGLSFGAYDVFATTDVRSTASITVSCDLTPPPDVTIAIGPSATSGQLIPRQMQCGSDILRYNVFIDPALTQVWGDGTGGGSTVTNRVMKNKPWVVTVYGRIPAQQDVRAGVYSDTLTVIINW
jgi:spore coat protein U-like protein